MMTYLLSLGAGLFVGVIYSLIGVRSPAPPYVAIVGLLGILIGEQVFPIVKVRLQNITRVRSGSTITKNKSKE